ncbi:copper amine oxidase N-terminal domain-containing protein [Bacillus sp. ISL-47]|uniref:copper amine oxidase N-terminal domain-containing protein n=1 Tax=Bacillus sp. ISL-47 TaxID=2819130 RepID=UPI001BE7B831|nr:copper amine oxidase N-terminal domain-containing protein [Bacillus sp. ISL-47]MBT2687443.1 copper amine oxidase N-terminal domain-containing protein [Bacillus sp. ISL-47]MBT2707095.1 copper amine oxidase N-terminal domain-containing protein [Pseudomonas sp. ISL-84]
MFARLRVLVVIAAVALSSLLSAGSSSVSAATLIGKGLYIKNGVTIEIDGKKTVFNDPILNKSGHLLLPMRDLYEAIDAKVYWDKKNQTASAVRNGKRVDLTINSTIAKVNDKKVTMNVAPLMYKYRTYVPLRFVSENLDGKVYWNQGEQTVEITLNHQKIPPEDPYVLHMNNKRIIMEDPLEERSGRTYIPADYFYNYLDSTSSNWVTDSQLEFQVAGLNFVFTNGSQNVLINQENVQIEEKPFIESGKMYVPVHFIVNALGGNLRILTDKRELYIYLYHYMFTSDFLEKTEGSTTRPAYVPNASLEGSRDLLVSDNPERVTPALVPNPAATLAQHNVNLADPVNEHRIFGWHLNKLGKEAKIGITIQNTSSINSLEVTGSKGYVKTSGNSWINYDIGLPIADKVLNDKLTDSASMGMVIQPGETKLIETYELHPNYIIGFLQDVDIRSINGGNSEYTIRTVLTTNNTDLTRIHSEPVPIDPYAAHPRGVWPNAEIRAVLPAYTVGSPEVGYNISNGKTDHFLTEENSLAKVNGSVGNSGHFGMNYKVDIPIINPTGEAKTIKLKIAGRGGLYSGAVKMNGIVYLIPTLKPSTEYVELPAYTVAGAEDMISLEIMHAGGASLPAAIYVEAQ